MNVFLLDEDHEARARAHCDVHVNKMLLEAVQMLNTALHKNDLGEYAFYQPTHTNHPWVEWTAGTCSNFEWMVEHARALGREFHHHRNDSEHMSALKLRRNWLDFWDGPVHVYDSIIDELPDDGDKVTPFPVCTGSSTYISESEDYPKLDGGPIEAYRDYYTTYKYPQDWFSYSVEPPEWLLDRV